MKNEAIMKMNKNLIYDNMNKVPLQQLAFCFILFDISLPKKEELEKYLGLIKKYTKYDEISKEVFNMVKKKKLSIK